MQTTDTLRDLLGRYLSENLIDPNPATAKKHEIAIRRLERTLGRVGTLADLTNGNLARMMNAMASEGLARPTINGYRAKIVAVWSWGCKQGWISVWPSTKKLKEPRRSPLAWSSREIGILWRSLDYVPGSLGGIPSPLWWKTYHLLAWDIGDRHTARMSMEWSHFSDFDAGEGVIPAEVRKGRGSDLPFILHPLTISLLREVRGLGAGKPLPWCLNELYFFQKYRAVLRRAELPHTPKHMTHCLRRSFATQLVAMGVDRAQVSKRLGHSDPTMIDLYIDPRFLPTTKAPHQLLFRPWEAPDDGPRAA